MSTEARSRYLVETDWLADHLEAPDIVIVDGSWYLPHMNRDPLAEYKAAHIPGAVYFDIDDIRDSSSDLPHMLPDPVKFSSRVRKLGISDGRQIIVYDGMGLFSAARVWWMFKVMGVDDVAVLNGGFAKWQAEGRPVTSRPPRIIEGHMSARLDHTAVRERDDLVKNLDTGYELVIDARPAGRFTGAEPEPREGVASGHIPGSVNIPFDALVNPDGTIRDNAELEDRFRSVGWTPGRHVTTSCGSGVTAAALTFALTLLGETEGGLYDGSWTEWGSDPDLPIETG